MGSPHHADGGRLDGDDGVLARSAVPLWRPMEGQYQWRSGGRALRVGFRRYTRRIEARVAPREQGAGR